MYRSCTEYPVFALACCFFCSSVVLVCLGSAVELLRWYFGQHSQELGRSGDSAVSGENTYIRGEGEKLKENHGREMEHSCCGRCQICRAVEARLLALICAGENSKVRTAFCKQANNQALETQGSAMQQLFCSFKTGCAECLHSGASAVEGS